MNIQNPAQSAAPLDGDPRVQPDGPLSGEVQRGGKNQWGELLAFPVERIEDERLRVLLRELAEAVTHTNDPDTLRALGQSLKTLGDCARNMAFEVNRSHW